ncbi:hypothetical protein SDC9_210946 [bioreactor metagenome]|uniref:FAD/NAD(P)-binding domain-containing protein n=1 Tax=bioreactor metagenome TaxID=1076179 RepID=A0A645JHU6_9ZZZZ
MPPDFSSVYLTGGLKGHIRDRRRVIVVEKARKVGEGLGVEKTYLLQELKYRGAEIYTDATIGEYTDNQITVNTDQGTLRLNRSILILAAGYRPGGLALLQYLKDNDLPFSVIGDAKVVGTFKEAFEDGFLEALRINI